jgi:chemotaxis protein MotB
MSRHPNRRRPSHDRWLISYADFITLLFALFVVLYAASQADSKKRQLVSASINSAFTSLGLFSDAMRRPGSGGRNASGSEKPAAPLSVVMGENVLSPVRVKDDLDRIQHELEQALAQQVADHSVSIHMGREGLVISLHEAGFFASGSAAPMPGTLLTLRQIAASLARTPYDLRVEGHTDNISIHTAEFDSNWELSSARATRIARIFQDIKAMPPDRISAAGYAEFHPVASNDTAAGRAENRRVDLVVLPLTKVDFSAPESAHPASAWRKINDPMTPAAPSH